MKSYFIFLNKPIGLTSQQCISRYKKQNNLKKTGHHGTLDPFASGLLLVGVNEATKYFSYVEDKKKVYEAEICLGIKTDTLDHTGAVLEKMTVPELCDEKIKETLKSFVGKSTQKPPMYSAVKKDGKKLYELARQGLVVERNERNIEVYKADFVSLKDNFLRVRFCVTRGTYVRVLAEDVSEALETCGHLSFLERQSLCGHDLGDINKMISISEMLAGFSKILLDDVQARDILNGKKVCLEPEGSQKTNTGPWQDNALSGEIRQVFNGDRFLGLGRLEGACIIAHRMMNSSDIL
ncbi:MAG: tRNA pseudouridine(55) synthase TruB [bacterium]|nr:tRNA pseudouridine(55) synthase TruB [bacterium]MBU1916706.1 tRNA pseudouridine(55) synthase TruB [bacterium]